ncbi:chitobiase/beta-hexosaminidase-like protein [Ruminiclostridium sufflavum DSM 19573]|uniref:Chitobiase/beta-hexosaminidase-like protein n=1 Tax=Ruminiclostridium sufflavum DSM 19573 TaxID=1121337 RepID=A0A318XSQ5_9FIRM|nr:DUF499 domain-containing protein [Ruminiclostridium sufflavum]PYG84914.1 chitobiase/beta-hexosaminidase-like protein [Ruminiclostridium sufflavum DSM 19573]
MKTIFQACKVRESVFDETKRDDTLDLGNLVNNSIDAKHFFEETFITEGMKLLFDTAFKRFRGQASGGIVKLTQAMGGGKTHNMVALGLLALDKKVRREILNGEYKNVDSDIRVVAYTGRESDLQYGIWGEIAKQLGKEELFNSYYTPLKAPGQSAWINLLKSDVPTLILLDELPPYLQYTKAVEIGTGTLADITTNALANLFNAIGKAELHNVCLVVSDLQATYEEGSHLLQQSFKELEGEIERSAINIEPVGANTDDLYNILRTRLFEKTASKDEIAEISSGFRNAVSEAKEMRLTNASPEEIVKGILTSYPFHPSVRDIFARFKENQGFQQTRGFIRLTRMMVKNLYSKDMMAKKRYLINAFDINLNDNELMTAVKSIKPELSNAISHDIANQGKSVSELMDLETKTSDMQDLSKLVLMSSLARVTGATIGLSMNEIIGYMAEPGRDITNLKKNIEDFKIKAWYLYTDKENRIFFKRVQNVNAELIETSKTYSYEVAKLKIKEMLATSFKPKMEDCYQQVLVFPSIEEIELKKDKITLILTEPVVGNTGLHSDVEKFYNDSTMKNRVMFLSGQRVTMDKLIEITKEYKAIESIIKRMEYEEKLPANDSQLIQAKDLFDKISVRLFSSIRETFITLYYPKKDGLQKSDFKMEFKSSNFDAEEQIKKVLIEVMKFTTDVDLNNLRKKFEVRIFTVQRMRWSDLMERVATTTSWEWHHPKALEELKTDALKKEIWIEEGGYLDKEPPAPETCVSCRVISRDDDTGEVTLKILPHNGDVVYYEINNDATIASMQVADINNFKTTELKLSFLCVDSKGTNSTGSLLYWTNDVLLKHKIYDNGGSQYIELKASSPNVVIKYTSDGSNPKDVGGVYDGAFEIPKGSKYIQAIAVNEKMGIYSAVKQIEVKEQKFELDKDKPVKLNEPLNATNTTESFALIESIRKFDTKVSGVSINIQEKNSGKFGWLSLDMGDFEVENVDKLTDELNSLIDNFFSDKKYEVNVTINNIKFETGQTFEQWVAEQKSTIESYKNKISQ